MQVTNIKVDTNLADEYCKQYRKLFESAEDKKMSDQLLIEAFLKDRLQEELEFVNSELEISESEI